MADAKNILSHLGITQVTHVDFSNNDLSPEVAKSLAPYFRGTHLICVNGIESKRIISAIAANFTYYWGKRFAEINYWRDDASKVALPVEIIENVFQRFAFSGPKEYKNKEKKRYTEAFLTEYRLL